MIGCNNIMATIITPMNQKTELFCHENPTVKEKRMAITAIKPTLNA